MSELDEIIVKLSVLDSNSSENQNNEALVNSVRHYLSENIANYNPIIDERIRSYLSAFNDTIREENKLELITVFSIIKTIKHVESLLSSSLNIDIMRKVNALLTSFFGLFKYHFQLPVNHNNYAFKNFGILLTSSSTNVLNPFISFMKLSNSSLNDINKSETLEKTFTLLLVFHCFNPEMFHFLSNFFKNKSTSNDIIQNFNLKSSSNRPSITSTNSSNSLNSSNSSHASISSSLMPNLFKLFQRFKMSVLLEESTLVVDTKSNNLLNIMFYSLFHKQFLLDFISNISDFNDFFYNWKVSDNLLEISNRLFLNPNILDYLTIFIVNDLNNLKILDNLVKSDLSTIKEKDVSILLLLKSCQNYLLNYNLFISPNRELLSYLDEYNNSNYTAILGISEENNISQLNISTLLPIFELINQNVKLNYLEERDFLTILKLSLVNLDLNLDSLDDFMNLNSLLLDVGCSLSIHALIDTIQTLLCIIINDIKFNHPVFNKIPKHYHSLLGFDYIPPVYRSNMSFENNIDLQAEFFGPIFQYLKDMENNSTIVQIASINYLEDCLTLILSIKTKIFRYLRSLNNETNVLRLPDLFSEESNNPNNKNEDYPLHVFRQGISTKIGSFKSSKSLNYKLLNSSINLGIISNLSLLVLAENYKSLKSSSNNLIDNSLSRILNEFTIDFSLTFLIIYQEFGLLSFFKNIRELNNESLKMVLPSALLLSKLFQVKNTDSKNVDSPTTPTTVSASSNSNFELISEILYKSVISSNLLRQYVELFDDGQSKPFKSLNKFLKSHPSTLKPSKITKGTITLDLNDYKAVLELRS